MCWWCTGDVYRAGVVEHEGNKSLENKIYNCRKANAGTLAQ